MMALLDLLALLVLLELQELQARKALQESPVHKVPPVLLVQKVIKAM
jgi:hypothetical protein